MAQSIGSTSTNGTAGAGATDFTGGTLPSWSAATTAGSDLQAVLGFCADPGAITWTGWTQHGTTQHNGAGCYLAIFGIKNAGSRSGNESPSWVNSVNAVCCAMLEIKGTDSTAQQDGGDQTATGANTSPAGGSLTTTNANDWVAAAIAQAQSGSATAPTWGTPTSGFTILSGSASSNVVGNRGNVRAGFVYQIVSATGTYTPGLTASGTNSTEAWVGLTYAIQASASASATKPVPAALRPPPGVPRGDDWDYLTGGGW